ncbi:MAG: AAA family ATPase [Sandaracinaceae bacterium]|nr:AAA family ATPase [Sandaracinaceae bacterium]
MHGLALVGRDAERAKLRALVDEAAGDGRLSAVLVTGEPGIGKSRLLHELRVATRAKRGVIVDACAYEAERRRAFGPILDALGRPEMPVEVRSLASAFASGSSADELTREQLFGTTAEVLAGLAERAPVTTLIVDDLQWLDECSAELLHYLSRALRRARVVLGLAARRGELPDADHVRSVVRGLRRDGRLSELALGPLGPDDTRALVRIGGEPPDADHAAAQSGGNPLFALELARAGAGAAETRSVRALVADRVEALPESAREVLSWAAVLGPVFDPMAVAALSGLDAEAHMRALEVLERRALVGLSEPGGAEGTLVFAHGVVHRTVYATLSDAMRRLMHARAAQALEARGRPEDATEIVRHAALAGDAERAARGCLVAAEQHVRVFARKEASRIAQRGLRFAAELSEPERTRLSIELHAALLAARRRGDDLAAAAPAVDELAERALDLGLLEHARLAFHVASYLRWEDDLPLDAARIMMRAEEVSRASEPRERALALAEAARCLVLLERDLAKSEAWLREADALARRERLEPLALADALAMLHVHRGELEQAEPLLVRTRDLARRERDLRTEARAIEHLALVALRRGMVFDASLHADELVRRIEREPLAQSEVAFARGLAAVTRLHLGRPGAEEELAQALDVLRGEDAKRRIIRLALAAAEPYARRGDAARALELAREALALAELMERPSDVTLACARIALASEALGDGASAEAHRARIRASPLDALSSEARAAATEVGGA